MLTKKLFLILFALYYFLYKLSRPLQEGDYVYSVKNYGEIKIYRDENGIPHISG